METEKKKALLELIKECDDAEYLRQISYTALVMANAVTAIKKANSLADESAHIKVKEEYKLDKDQFVSDLSSIVKKSVSK